VTTPFVIIIPARWQSTRLPGKPLCDIEGQTMIQRVVAQAMLSAASRVIVATDHQDIKQALKRSACEVVMTQADLPSGTDRLAAAAASLKLSDDTIVVNLQGDEPLMPRECLDQVAEGIAHAQTEMATLACRFDHLEQLSDPNCVKVVTSLANRALYFSRAAIPFNRDQDPTKTDDYLRHIGLYAYRVGFLRQFVQWPPTRLEQLEKLEQLRALAYGAEILVEQSVRAVPAGVDTQEDLEQVRQYYREGNLP
jgi:3-deoxy-manno-octulosonate cytidylyltransferase (CMP-KDO synthetase)